MISRRARVHPGLIGVDPPEGDANRKVVFILAGYLAGFATHAAILIVEETLSSHTALPALVTNPA
jgi:hypothetical protein